MPSSTDPRIVLALERTLLAWTRTALALVGLGFLVARLAVLARDVTTTASSPIGPRSVGVGLVVLAGVVQLLAILDHTRHVRRLREGETLPLTMVSPAVVLGAVIVMMALAVAAHLVRLSV